MRCNRLWLGVALFAAVLSPVFAADAKIADVKFGEVLVGPKLKPDDLKGHVVLIELWGLR